MDPGKVTTDDGVWITTLESGHFLMQGSLELLPTGCGTATPQGLEQMPELRAGETSLCDGGKPETHSKV